MRLGKTAFFLLLLGLSRVPGLASESFFPQHRTAASIVIVLFIGLTLVAVGGFLNWKGMFPGWVEERLPRLTLARGAVFTGVFTLWMALLFLLMYLSADSWQILMRGTLPFICGVLTVSLLEGRWLRSDLAHHGYAAPLSAPDGEA
jgi:hypothetical protein